MAQRSPATVLMTLARIVVSEQILHRDLIPPHLHPRFAKTSHRNQRRILLGGLFEITVVAQMHGEIDGKLAVNRPA
jgi:hypothetical protein